MFYAPLHRLGRELVVSFETVLGSWRNAWFGVTAVSVASLASFWIYVPVHELLHAVGCLATGGAVHELQIQQRYGGGLLAAWIPFVRAGGPYAGRLSGFDTGGSDAVHLAATAAPFLLTVAFGYALLRVARLRASALALGAAAALLSAPLLSVGGDYYEIGSILVSRVISIAAPDAAARAMALRHDDLIALAAELRVRFPEATLGWAFAAGAATMVGLALAGATLEASERVARALRLAPPVAARPAWGAGRRA